MTIVGWASEWCGGCYKPLTSVVAAVVAEMAAYEQTHQQGVVILQGPLSAASC